MWIRVFVIIYRVGILVFCFFVWRENFLRSLIFYVVFLGVKMKFWREWRLRGSWFGFLGISFIIFSVLFSFWFFI